MWGSDYPHMESTFQYPGTTDFDGHTSYGKLALRFTFAGLDEPHVRAILGETACRVYDLDRGELANVARTIGAPTYDEVNTPLATVPEGASTFAFRTVGPWA